MSAPLVLEVIPSLPVTTVADLILYARANPAKLNLASFGTGTVSHLSGELFKMMTGTEMVHVPYRGSAPMLTDLLGGRVHVAFDAIPASLEHIRAGSLRALGVTSALRMETLPDTPTIGEFLAGYEVGALAGIGAPRDTPGEIIMELNQEINSALADSNFRARLTGLGATGLSGTPSDYRQLLAAETEKRGKVIKSAGLKPE
jgi:tripartite-type tricarboxylate transporter receptor subunit TctC